MPDHDQPAHGPLPDVLAALVVGPHDHLVLNFARADHATIQAIRAQMEQHPDLAARVLVVNDAEMAVIRHQPARMPPTQRNGHNGPMG